MHVDRTVSYSVVWHSYTQTSILACNSIPPRVLLTWRQQHRLGSQRTIRIQCPIPRNHFAMFSTASAYMTSQCFPCQSSCNREHGSHCVIPNTATAETRLVQMNRHLPGYLKLNLKELGYNHDSIVDLLNRA